MSGLCQAERNLLTIIRDMTNPEHLGFEGHPKDLPLEQRRSIVRGIAEVAINVSSGRLRIATHEQSASRETNQVAATFLKLDEKRIGRDFEQYVFFAQAFGWEEMLPYILQEVINPLEAASLPESYKRASRRLQSIGDTVYTGDLRKEWDALFDAPAQQVAIPESDRPELDLITPDGVRSYMLGSTSEEDWGTRCDAVIAANNGTYPSFWYPTIVMGLIPNKARKNWEE